MSKYISESSSFSDRNSLFLRIVTLKLSTHSDFRCSMNLLIVAMLREVRGPAKTLWRWTLTILLERAVMLDLSRDSLAGLSIEVFAELVDSFFLSCLFKNRVNPSPPVEMILRLDFSMLLCDFSKDGSLFSSPHLTVGG